MKKLSLITFLVITLNQPLFSQYYPAWISSYYSYIEISVEYTRSTNYPSFNYSDALATKQSQYDAAIAEVNSVYGQMNKLQLLNKYNRENLNTYRDKYFKWIEQEAGKMDLSISKNKQWVINNFKKPVTDNKSIRNEIKILNRIAKEVDFIEHQTGKLSEEQLVKIEDRKNDIYWFLFEYENADPTKAKDLLKKYDLDLIMFGDFLE